MGIVSGGGGGGGVSAVPPLTLTGTNPATIPLTVKGAAGESEAIIKVLSNDNTIGLQVDGNSANSLGTVSLAGPNFGLVQLTPNGETAIGADTRVVFEFARSFVLSGFNAATTTADLAAGDLGLWFDATNGAAKLMVKAKQADGTVVTAAVALA